MLWYAPPDWVNTNGYKIENCEYTNCEISFDKKEIKNSDLVLFHHNNMNIKSPMKMKTNLECGLNKNVTSN
jgi:hypothetical protein